MELDEFKQLYKEKIAVETTSHSADELEGYMHNKTRSITGKIKRSIIFEFAAAVLFVAMAVWAWFQDPASLARPFSLFIITLCCIFFLYLGGLYNKLTTYENMPAPVKSNLQQIITILQQFTRLYFQFTMVTLPIVFIFGLIAGYFTVTGDTLIKDFNWLRGLIFYATGFIIWWTAMYFFTRYYIKKLYGNYLLQLQQQLNDIENG